MRPDAFQYPHPRRVLNPHPTLKPEEPHLVCSKGPEFSDDPVGPGVAGCGHALDGSPFTAFVSATGATPPWGVSIWLSLKGRGYRILREHRVCQLAHAQRMLLDRVGDSGSSLTTDPVPGAGPRDAPNPLWSSV